MHSYPSPQILLYMGQESSFLPLSMQSYPSLQILSHMGNSQAFFCSNAKLSFLTNPSHSMYGRILLHNAELLHILSRKSFFFSSFFILSLFIYFFTSFYYFFWSYFFKFLFNFLFFLAKLEILPQREKNYSPVFGVSNRRIDALITNHQQIFSLFSWT